MGAKNSLPFNITLFVAFFILSLQNTYAQQWSGSSGTSGNIQRTGDVEIGDGLLEGNDANLYVNEGRARYGYNGLRKAARIWAGGGKHIVFDTDGDNERMRIDKDGRVGIGVWNPSARLEVAGNLYIQRGSELNFTVNNGDKRAGIKSTNSNPYNELQFFVGGYQEAMRIKANGNVGIGTTNPDEKLTVNGKIHAKEVKVTATAGADFVFAENYTPPTLEEVESYVKTYRHLPEIPSADEMIENGVQLGEFQIKLLQKIEELTLYMIALEKENKKLQEEMTVLKTIVNKR